MRIGFVTCVQLGLQCLEAVCAGGGRFALVVTLADETARAKSGRVGFDEFCERHQTPLLKVKNINDVEVVERLRAAQLDWLFIVGWSQIARAPIINAARLGSLGMHPTLLPTGRGRAAIPWAILKGLDRTGVTLFRIDEGVDTGPIAAQVTIPMTPGETATSLYAKAGEAHVRLLLESWPALMQGDLAFTVQDHARATVWPGRRPEDGRIDLPMPIATAERLIRAVTHPYPGAFFDTDAGRVRVWAAAVAENALVPSPNPGFDPQRATLTFPDGVLRLLDWHLEAPAGSIIP